METRGGGSAGAQNMKDEGDSLLREEILIGAQWVGFFDKLLNTESVQCYP